MRTTLFSLLGGAALLMSASSCMQEIDYSSDARLQLTFSSDTVRFDTLFASIPSATQWVKVYNRNREHLLISDIRLEGGASSPYRINVDGEHGAHFSNLELRGRDSLYIAIEVTLPPSGAATPTELGDAIRFTLNGKTERLELSAWGWDAHLWRGRVVEESEQLNSEKPYLIYDSLVVAAGSTLTLEAGSRLFFHNTAAFKVHGKLLSLGEVGRPVELSGDRLDRVLPDLSYDQMGGQWQGVVLAPESYENVIRHTIIRSAVVALRADSSDVSRSKVNFVNALLHNTTGVVLRANHCQISAVGSQFSNGEGGALRLEGGSYHFMHCTLAGYSPFAATRGASLQLPGEAPLDFWMGNSIVYGRLRDEVTMGAASEVRNIQFDHCILRKREESGEMWNEIRWNVDPKFAIVGTNYNYDFRLQAESPAINQASTNSETVNLLDFYGVNRQVDSSPDIGAFEFAATKQ